ncbi:MAG: hypothetical protein R2813_13655 [Flavobacteriales bacterium]
MNRLVVVLLLLHGVGAYSQREITGYSDEIRNKVHTTLENVKPQEVFIYSISGPYVREIPEELYKLPNLAYLRITNTNLRSITIPAGAFPALTTLDLRNNKLSQITFEEGSARLIEELILQYNELREVPKFPSHWKLQDLDLRYNKISELYAQTGLESLEKIYLDANPLENPEVAFLLSPYIKLISFYDVQALNVPSHACPKLKYLIISNCRELKWAASPEDFPSLRELDLIFSRFDRATLDAVCSFKKLSYLNLDHCDLDAVPVEKIVAMKKLQTLSLIGNPMHPIPKELLGMKLKKFNY